MFNRRIIGVFLTLGLAFAPWSHAHAQEVAAPEETTPEIQINEPVEQPEQSIPDLGHEQETPTETVPSLPPVEGSENNDPNRLESIGLEISDAENQELTPEQIAALSEADKQDMAAAGLIWENVTTEEVSADEAGFEQEAGDCVPTRFYNCSLYRIALQHCTGTIRRPKCTEIGKRWFLFRVENTMNSDNQMVFAQSYVQITHTRGHPLDELLTFTLLDENKKPMSIQMHASTIDIKKVFRYDLGKLLLSVPYSAPGEPPVKQHGGLETNFTHYVMTLDMTQAARIRCSGAWNSAHRNCVNPDFQPTIIFDRATFPYIADNIETAIATGKPSVLTRDNTEVTANRNAACPKSQLKRLDKLGPKPKNMVSPSCDEYPFASSKEGGEKAQVMWVPLAENTEQGKLISAFLKEQQVQNNDKYKVKVI